MYKTLLAPYQYIASENYSLTKCATYIRNTSFLHHFLDKNPYYYAPYNTSLNTGSQGFSDQT
jgi:hypothetical protein